MAVMLCDDVDRQAVNDDDPEKDKKKKHGADQADVDENDFGPDAFCCTFVDDESADVEL